MHLVFATQYLPLKQPSCQIMKCTQHLLAYLQNLAVDMLYYFPTLHEATARTCALVCLTPIYPLQLALRVLDSLCSTHPRENGSELISFLVTVLLGRVNSAQMTVSRSRHEALVQAACRAVPRIAPPGT